MRRAGPSGHLPTASTLSFIPSVSFEQSRQTTSDRARVEPELLETVAVPRLVLARAFALGEQHLAVLRRERQPELAVDLLDRRRRVGHEVAVVDHRVLDLGMAREHLERIEIGVERLIGEDREAALLARRVPAERLPARAAQLQAPG